MKQFFTILVGCILTTSLLAQPANNDCAGATTLTVHPSDNAVFTQGTTANATLSQPVCFGSGTGDVYYKFTATETSHSIIVQQNGMSSNPVFQVFSGECGSLTQIVCFNGFPANTTLTGLTIGTSYTIRVYASTAGGAGGFSIAVVGRPTNNDCVNATSLAPFALGASGNYTKGSTFSSTSGLVVCSFIVDPVDVWYKFTATATAHRIEVRNYRNNNVRMNMFTGDCSNRTIVGGCGGSTFSGNSVIFSMGNLVVGQEYLVRVYGTNALGSDFEIGVLTPIVATNDECGNATELTPASGNSCITTSSSLALSTSSLGQNCDASGTTPIDFRDVWFRFTATATAHSIKTTTPSFHSREVTIFRGQCNNLTRISCISSSALEDSLALGGLIPGEVYTIRVGSSFTNISDFGICISTPTFAPNDECANATEIFSSGGTDCIRTIGNTTQASQNGLTCLTAFFSATPAYDLWYKFEATKTSHRLRLAANNGGDVRMQIFSGSCNGLTSIQDCGTATTATDSIREVRLNNLTIGQTYFVRVATFKTALGQFNLCLKDVVPPVNDDCPGAKELTVGASMATMPAFTFTNMLDVSQSLPGCVGTAEDDLWYTFEATAANVGVYTSFVTNDQVLQVFTGPCDNLQSIACIQQPQVNARASFDLANLTPGTRYRMRLYTVGNFIWSSAFSQSISMFNKTLPDNNACLNAIVLNPAAGNQCNAVSSTTVDATNTRAACTNASTRDIWFKFDATATTHFIQVWGFLFSPRIELLQGSCENLSSIVCFNDNSSATTSQNSPRITRRELTGLTPGNTYWLKISANDPSFERDGIFNICLTTPDAPVNDECAGAISVPVCTGGECEAQGLFTTNRATQSIPNCFGSNPANDIWFKFSTDKQVMIVIDNLNRQVRQEVFTGTCDNLVPVANTCTNLHIQTLAKPNTMTEYFLRVYSNEPISNGSLEFTLKIFEVQDIKLNSTIDSGCVTTNVLINPSFELASTCPTGFIGTATPGSSIGTLTGWTFPTSGTADFFNACATSSTNSAHIPGNLCFGSQEPRSGNGYVGLFALTSSSYKEYLQGQLATPMVPGKKYLVSFYVSLAEFSNTAVDKLGALFRTSALNLNSSSTLIATPHVESVAGSVLKDKAKWINVSGIFEPAEEYTHVIIGNFRANSNLTIETVSDISGGVNGGSHPGCGSPGTNSYYYIDDVFIGEINETTSSNCGTLPVTWLSFTATARQADAHLEWKTTNESKCNTFEVERSRDGVNYTTIGTQLCRNSSGVQQYAYTDMQPGKGTFYYRLRQVDIDGTHDYSQVRKVSFGEDGGIRAYPNPVRDRLLLSNVPGNSDVRLYDAMGRLVLLQRTAQPLSTLAVGHLPAGLYELLITTTTGERLVQKIQIQR